MSVLQLALHVMDRLMSASERESNISSHDRVQNKVTLHKSKHFMM